MNTIKLIEKMNKQFAIFCNKFVNKINTKQYIQIFGTFQPISFKQGEKDFILTTTPFSNITTRNTIVNTLRKTNYKRNQEKWNSFTAIGFMQEVINLYNIGQDEMFNEKAKEISDRYNVPINRFKTQIALFITNLEQGNDKFGILDYFTIYDIVNWKYRDLDKLQEDVQNNKIPENELQAIKELYNI